MLVGTISADPLGVLVAFGAGILSFLSPCVLPLVPGYLSLVSGLSAAELHAGARSPRREAAMVGATVGAAATVGATATVGAAPTPVGVASIPASRGRRRLTPLLRGIFLFVAGFTVVFVAEGAVASGLHSLIEAHKSTFATAGGALVLVLGLVLVAGSLPAGVWTRLGAGVSGRVGWLVGERRLHVRPGALGMWAAPVMGMAFAFAWTPCIGPVLAAVLAMAATRDTLAGGVLLLVAYSLGLGVPFFVTGVAFDRLTGFYGRARRRLAMVQIAAGIVLAAFGVLLLAGDLTWLSAQFNTLLNDVGLHCSTSAGCFG
ncbi:MAG: cytochrome c biogenesis CcdA family protein [Acidimicrobiales bacterium]